MSIWTRIADAIAALAKGESLAQVFETLRTPPEKSVAFTIAVIGLGAKMAKADGRVTRDEVTAFREVFHIPKRDEAQAARVFNLARQDAAGFEVYANTIARMFGADDVVLRNLIEGLFHIAVADGEYHPKENDYVHRVAQIFGLPDQIFRGIKNRFVPDATPDAYDVLGVSADMALDEIRKVWRDMIRENHPDRLIAKGLPEEAVSLATRRMVALNQAWETISETHGR
ncbi:MAG: molecular chaperone DjiA [Pseudomonadota bacterium]